MNGYLRNIWKVTEMSIKSVRLGPLLLLLRVTEHSVRQQQSFTPQHRKIQSIWPHVVKQSVCSAELT